MSETDASIKDESKKTLSLAAFPVAINSPIKAYTQNIGRRIPSLQWEAPEWDLAECSRIFDVEGIFRRALRTQLDLFLKEGFEFNGPNVERSKYVMRRLEQIENATNKPFPILLSETVASLQRTSNAFWVKVRNYKASGGKIRTVGRKELDPVAGYFLLPAESIQIKRDEYGVVKKYRQEVYGKKPKEFKPEDVIHFYFDRREGFSVGTPRVVPVKDDIRALRRLEENLELLVYQHLFPLFHYKVGTEQNPAGVTSNGDDEVIVMQTKIAEMPSDGCWVTSERHEIKSLKAESPPVAIEKVIDHFKHRIYIGLGVSPIDVGESTSGASRSVAQTLSRNLVNSTKAYQKEFGAQFYLFVIRELLLESTFSSDTLFNEENKVFLRFREIDQETRIAKENHLADMFLKNIVSHDEVRIESGRQPFVGDGWPTGISKKQMFTKGDGDFSKTNYGLIERDKIILQSLDEPGTPTSQSEAQSRTKTNSSKSAGGNSVSNKNQPQNQHGTRSSAKLNKDSFIHKSKFPGLSSVLNQKAPLSSTYNVVKDQILNRVYKNGVEKKVIAYNLNYAFTEAAKRLISLSKRAFRTGLEEKGHHIWEVQIDKADAKINDHIKKYVRKLQVEILHHIDNNTVPGKELNGENALFISMIFDTLEYRSRSIDNNEVVRAYNYGLLVGMQLSGIEEVKSDYPEDGDCEKCKDASLQSFPTNAIIYEELPPYHSWCTCKLKATKE